VVSDIEAARAELTGRWMDVGEFFHFGPSGRAPGLEPNRADYGSFYSLSDPNRNTWMVQEVKRTPRE
jgi:hypothetical protein